MAAFLVDLLGFLVLFLALLLGVEAFCGDAAPPTGAAAADVEAAVDLDAAFLVLLAPPAFFAIFFDPVAFFVLFAPVDFFATLPLAIINK